jgi:hypothetical protein
MSAWKDYKAKLGEARPWDFLNSNTQYSSEELENSRMDICNECDRLLITKQCKECGCFMPLKVKLFHATCPLQKW